MRLALGAISVPVSSVNHSVRAGSGKNSSSEKRPDFFIVGAPKCGTTALDHYLGAHPDIFMAKKELHFFGTDLRFGPQIYCRDLEGYLAEFNGWNGQRQAGESSVWYLFSSRAASEIKAFNPDARIIIMLREPVAMLYSLYNQFRFDGNENLKSFEAALAAEDERRAGHRLTRRTYFAQGLAYRAAARFTEQIQRYFDTFGRERVHVIIYDDFVADTAGTLTKALDFLGINSSLNIPLTPVNESMSVKSAVLRNILNDPLVRGTAIALRPWVPRQVFGAFQVIQNKLFQLNKQPAKRSPLDPDLQRSLRQEFTPEVERLSALLGRDLTRWSVCGPSDGVSPVRSFSVSDEMTSGSFQLFRQAGKLPD